MGWIIVHEVEGKPSRYYRAGWVFVADIDKAFVFEEKREALRILRELNRDGLFYGGHYRFKNKFVRPFEMRKHKMSVVERGSIPCPA